MAHFAQINEINKVTQVIVVNNSVLVDPEPVVINGIMYTNGESEALGIEFCKGLYGADTNWVQTSYNGSFRGKYAAIGDTYDPVTNLFIDPFVEPVLVDTPVVESEVVIETPQITQEPIGLSSTDIPVLTSSDVIALTSEQISGL